MERIGEGLWRWTAWHAEWKQEVGSVYLETADAVVLIDPLVPPDDPAAFWRALDRDVSRARVPVHVLVTVFWHTRSTAEVVARYDARPWAPSRGRRPVERRAGGAVTTFRPGDPLPGGAVAFATGRSSEVVYWLPQHRALVPGDVILGAEGGGLRICPESWLPDGVGHAEVRKAMRPLLELPVERVLVSHGEPVVKGAADALAEALGRRR